MAPQQSLDPPPPPTFDAMQNLYGVGPQVGERRRREEDVVVGMGDGPPAQFQRVREPEKPYNIAINLAHPMSRRNPIIRHPPMRDERTGRLYYRGSTLPPVMYMPLSGEQARRPTVGAAAEA